MPPGLRETKRAALAAQLATIAFDQVRRVGFGAVTIDDIVAEANVSRRTFSNYYACKEAAVAAVVGHRARTALEQWRPPATRDVVALVADLVAHQAERGALQSLVEVAALTEGHPQLVPYVHEAQWRLWATVGERVLAALDGPTPDEAETVPLVVGALFGVVSAGLRPGEQPAAATPHELQRAVGRTLERLRAGVVSGH